ncbi:hypothetical protein O3G_MSEX014581 [Manduca sexta]|uniref:USP domain-containing protein n=1 Tax=Manduca sexta TaxID=7130 RepID=A0A921ZW07_MANSE|nr:hypothetical protein O3G_MSEX014581 [Manduca sexta]KAG6464531.1 hypothetical protein O3G_MSEX014581 [Manduca sexta]
MDLMKTEYEFLDLSDVKDADLSSLQCALFEQIPDSTAAELSVGRYQTAIDTSSRSSSTAGPPKVSGSVDSLSGGEGEMAPHSPARGAAGPPPHPPPYAQPPPAYPPPHHQWPVAPPNVYVSQVTANVNVHGYMGQYYQPPAPQYAPPPQERAPRTHRRDRRTKRQPSPPPHAPQPYYVQYPQYYPAAQAQGAPLYHLPVYQPLVYGPYAYPSYYPEYPLPVEGDADKGPEEYPPEVVMEQEAVDAYYASAHYAGQPYGPPVDGAVEYVPPMYLPPPHHPPPVQQAPHHHPAPHQFNVHAKNFVAGQGRTYMQPEKIQERRTPPTTTAATVSATTVDALPIKELKITNKGPGSPKQTDRSDSSGPLPKQITLATEKVPPKTEPKPTGTPPEKTESVSASQAQIAARTFPPLATGATSTSASKVPPNASKPTKGPAAPFSGGKPPAKSTAPQTIIPVQQNATTPKAPFGNRQKRDGPANRSPSNEISEGGDRSNAGIEHIKREPPLPPSKAPMPISINLHSPGQPLIVSGKAPFGHSRKTGPSIPEPPPAPQPPPPAPTASDFPPPPTPRNRTEPPPVTVPPQPQPAPGKSWASLFSTKPAAPAPAPVAPPVATIEEPVSPTSISPPTAPNVQKPVAKVPPFDASPLSGSTPDKVSPTNAPSTVSYSEKTSVNAVSATSVASATPKPTTPSQPAAETREVPVQKDSPAAPVQPSPFSDDPNSYRMGEFLTKYQLDNKPVQIVPRGLTNRSNYCYVNAILQALIACPPFYNLLKSMPYQTRRGKSSTPVIDSM